MRATTAVGRNIPEFILPFRQNQNLDHSPSTTPDVVLSKVMFYYSIHQQLFLPVSQWSMKQPVLYGLYRYVWAAALWIWSHLSAPFICINILGQTCFHLIQSQGSFRQKDELASWPTVYVGSICGLEVKMKSDFWTNTVSQNPIFNSTEKYIPV